MLTYRSVSLRKSENLLFTLVVRDWEVPVLRAVHGPENVVAGEAQLVNDDPPDAVAEYNRLELLYKADTDTGQSFVGMAFGLGERGLELLAAAIAKGTVEAPDSGPTLDDLIGPIEAEKGDGAVPITV